MEVIIMHDIGDKTSLGEINANATAKVLSSPTFNVSAILDCSITDSKVVEAIEAEFKHRYNVNEKGPSESWPAIEQKLNDFGKIWHEKDPNNFNLTAFTNMVEMAKGLYLDQKKNKQPVA